MKIEEALDRRCVLSDLVGNSKKEIIGELVKALGDAHLVEDTEKAAAVVMERERLGSTGIGDGVAIPHGKLKGVGSILCAFGKSKAGVDFDAVDHAPVHIFFLLIAPEDSASLHLKMLSRISIILRDPSFRKNLVEIDTAEGLYEKIVEEDRKHP